MTSPDHDLLTTDLAALTVEAPAELLDRIAARWVRAQGPVGELYVASTHQGIAFVRTAEGLDDEAFAAAFHRRFARPLLPADRPPAGLLPALRAGRATELRYDLRDLSEFEQAVLRTALTIPKGQLRPYSWVAKEIGRPKAVRAVGSALGHNPVPILIPCHRVTRSDGAIGQYVFGTQTKERLLRAEGVDLDETHELAKSKVFYLGSDTTGIVCFPTCHHAQRISPPHRRGFRSMAQAEQAGYRPCKHCRPALAATA